jgi:hypothetical protein
VLKILVTVIWVKKEDKELKSGVMARLTPESIFGEIWYGGRGLHQIGTHIRCTYPHLN